MHDKGYKTPEIVLKKKQKTVATVAILGLIGVLLIFVSNYYSEKSEDEYTNYEAYATQIEKKLESFLLEIDGIFAVRVIVTLDYIQDAEGDGYIYAGANENTTQLPSVRGVAIACTNGGDYKVKVKLTELVSAYLGISSNRIEIIDIK